MSVGIERPAEPLDRRACLALLSTVAVGRVAWAASSGVVVVLPVNFLLDAQAVVFSTGPGDKLAAVRAGSAFTFEADDIERATRTGWSVLVTGAADVVDDPGQIRRIEQLHLDTWAPAPSRSFVRLRIQEISGRLLPLRPGRVTVERVG
ncbi:pyridoxamine 5'-phosphate oxidase family protein [Pseudonocardia saturnea]